LEPRLGRHRCSISINLVVFLFVISVLRVLRNVCLRVLEVGSYNVNGSPHDWIFGNLCVAEYDGVDIRLQRECVDVIADASALPSMDESFDVVIFTETLEHVEDWHSAVTEMKRVLKRGGPLVITIRSPGFPLHSYLYVFWRFTIDDFKAIFSDMKMLKLVEDPQGSGILFAGVKIYNGHVTPRISVYSMALARRALDIPKVTGACALFIRALCKCLEHLVLTLLMLMLGFEYPVAWDLRSMARKCRV